ncbi:hypothetical protein IG631_17041 [Alternaria alternata]|nr:hypothetical protein IG631_17041 [Alternaria alternata]
MIKTSSLQRPFRAQIVSSPGHTDECRSGDLWIAARDVSSGRLEICSTHLYHVCPVLHGRIAACMDPGECHSRHPSRALRMVSPQTQCCIDKPCLHWKFIDCV